MIQIQGTFSLACLSLNFPENIVGTLPKSLKHSLKCLKMTWNVFWAIIFWKCEKLPNLERAFLYFFLTMSLTYIIAVSFLNKIHLIPSRFDEFDEWTQGFESPWFLIDDNTNWIAAALRVINVHLASIWTALCFRQFLGPGCII